MCGIVGLLLRSKPLREQLGRLMLPMFETMSARGPDSGGCAFFAGDAEAGTRKFSLLALEAGYPWQDFESRFTQCARDIGSGQWKLSSVENHALLTVDTKRDVFEEWLVFEVPEVKLLAVGRSIDVFKDVGNPVDIARRYHFGEMTGSHCVGHTRMATESAVTALHSHPYTAGEDFCLVHNGSLSNPYMLRRMLENEGILFETDNDTEAACRFLQWRLAQGDDLVSALGIALTRLDGFYTLLMATGEQMCLVRDAFACKPAVVAETDDYVAVSSEYRCLAHLPGIEHADLYEPKPEEVYAWEV